MQLVTLVLARIISAIAMVFLVYPVLIIMVDLFVLATPIFFFVSEQFSVNVLAWAAAPLMADSYYDIAMRIISTLSFIGIGIGLAAPRFRNRLAEMLSKRNKVAQVYFFGFFGTVSITVAYAHFSLSDLPYRTVEIFGILSISFGVLHVAALLSHLSFLKLVKFVDYLEHKK